MVQTLFLCGCNGFKKLQLSTHDYEKIMEKHLKLCAICIRIAESLQSTPTSPLEHTTGTPHTATTTHLDAQLETDLFLAFAEWAVECALVLDHAQEHANAFTIYMMCLDAWMHVRNAWSTKPTRDTLSTSPHTTFHQLTQNIRLVMDRAEDVKKFTTKCSPLSTNTSSRKRPPALITSKPSSSSSSSSITSPKTPLSRHEVMVLKKSSHINNLTFLPFDYNLDVHQKLQSQPSSPHQQLFEDNHGKLTLSNTQLKHFAAWKRPREFLPHKPQMFSAVSALTIRQDIVSDCSFIASLCVAAHYETRFNTRLVSNMIYPLNPQSGESMYNESGWYCVKLYANGCPRAVVIDDYLPCDRNNRLLCAHSLHNDLWVPLIEKAFLKLNGGYTFPGSNSGIDMYALTGWIPEDVHIKSDHRTFDHNEWWNRLYDGHLTGAAVATISTGRGNDELQQVGLDAEHAYALLNLIELPKSRSRMVLLKNPWCRGTFRPVNEFSSQLMKELNYCETRATYEKNGMFWIEWDSICTYFDTLHISWRPKSFFSEEHIRHGQWKSSHAPYFSKRDQFNFSYNPQFRLRVSGNGPIWIVLTRHCTDIEDLHKNFITLHVYKGSEKHDSVEFVRSKSDKKLVHEGTYVNNMHYRVCIDGSRGDDERRKHHDYILVVSQYQDIRTVEFSISTFSSMSHEIVSLPTIVSDGGHAPRWHTVASVQGAWKGGNAGGNHLSTASHLRNPQYQLDILSTHCKLYLTLEACKEFAICIMIFKMEGPLKEAATQDNVHSLSAYRLGFTYTDVFECSLGEGSYCVVVNTHDAGQECTFLLSAVSDTRDSVRLTVLASE